ncbi:MAG: 50S ribosomal protein L30 [Candidatus Odinarchaeota archaeon]|nr:50S ribosomal protein L30 [Candidatus Odinarchaeota archaeon]
MSDKLLAVIRIRGRVSVRNDIDYTLNLLRLNKKFHLILIWNDPSYKGMLQKVKDYVTWGEIDKETLELLLKNRGRIVGNEKISEDFLKENTNFNSFSELADALISGKVKLKDIPWLKPVFRLHPPKGGFKHSTKRPFKDLGELGYRGAEINQLIKRMI